MHSLYLPSKLPKAINHRLSESIIVSVNLLRSQVQGTEVQDESPVASSHRVAVLHASGIVILFPSRTAITFSSPPASEVAERRPPRSWKTGAYFMAC